VNTCCNTFFGRALYFEKEKNRDRRTIGTVNYRDYKEAKISRFDKLKQQNHQTYGADIIKAIHDLAILLDILLDKLLVIKTTLEMKKQYISYS